MTIPFTSAELAVRLGRLDYARIRQICQEVVVNGGRRSYDLEVIIPQNWVDPSALGTYRKGFYGGVILLKDCPTPASTYVLAHELGHHFDPFLYGDVASSQEELPWAERDIECWAEAVATAHSCWEPRREDHWGGMGEAYSVYLPMIRAHFASQRAAANTPAPRPYGGLKSNSRRLRQEWEAGRDEF